MQDESLIDEMRAALKGDRERAELRRRTASPDGKRSTVIDAPAADTEVRPGLFARLGLRRAKA